MSVSGWWSARRAGLRERLARTAGRIVTIRRTLFIRHLDSQPEALLDSALADAEARNLDKLCVFFSHQADPGLLESALGRDRVSGVGSKDSFPASLLPAGLRGDARVGRYWEPGLWRLPNGTAHIYFVGPWRLLTPAMLLEAVRAGAVSLRCRVATSWWPVPLRGMRVLRLLARASGFAAVASGGRSVARLAKASPGIAADARRKLALIRATLFIRHLDSMPETLLASALADAERRGLDRVTIFFSHVVDAQTLTAVLEDGRVAAVGTKDAQFESLLPPALVEDRRVGRYWEPGEWALPEAAEHVYFIGPWRLMTPAMIREALRREVASLRVRVSTSWATVPLDTIRAALPVIRLATRATGPVLSAAARLGDMSRGAAARAIVFARPEWAEAAARLAGRRGLSGDSLQRAFRHMLRNRPPGIEVVPGRVVLVCGNLAPGGAERQVTYTVQGLAARRFDTALLCHNLAGDTKHRYDFYLPAVEAAGVKAREIRRDTGWLDYDAMPPGLREVARLLPPGLANDIADLYAELVELRPQVVHTWLDWDNVRGGLAAALAGVPRIVVSGRNINPSNFALYQPYMDPAYRALARLPNVVLINNSRAGADDYADWIGIPRARIGVVHNAVDFGARRRLPAAERSGLRASLGIPETAFLVGGVFRLEEEKRPLLWIAAAALLARQLPDAHFVIFGQGTMRDAVRQAAEQEGVADRLTLAGVTNDVLSAMSIMDVFLLASFGEGLPNVLLEAQWVGTPVVVTDVGGAREAVEPGVTGWALATDDPAELAAKIKWLHDNPAILANARTRGPEWVREQFGVERMVAETVRAYGLADLPAEAPPSTGAREEPLGAAKTSGDGSETSGRLARRGKAL